MRATSSSRSLVALGLILVAGWFATPRSRSGVLAWLLPLLFVINVIASAPRLYPFGVVRLSLFITPLLCILFAAGLGLLVRRGDHLWLRYLVMIALLYPLLYANLTGARPYLARGWQREDIRGLVQILTTEKRPGEGLYVNQDAEPAFRFYWHRSGRDPEREEIVWGERHRVAPEQHAEQIIGLPSRYDRFWGLFSHMPVSELSVVRGLILERYDLVRSDVAGDARLELYRLRSAGNVD